MSVAGVEWVKLAVGTFDDEKVKLIRSMPDGDTMALVWVQLICHAGKTNADGLVRVAAGLPYSDEMLATVLGHPISTVRLAINTFAKFGMVTLDEHGIWLTNWDKYQNIDGMQRIREQARIRKQRQRARLAAEKQVLALPPAMSRDMSRDVTQENKNKKEDKDTDTDIRIRPASRDCVTPTPLIEELSHLPGWAQSKDNHDSEWCAEFLSEFPSLSSSVIRACRDYHCDKKKHTKGLWKTRLRHWMEREVKNNGNGQHDKSRRSARALPERDEYEAPPVYTRPLLRD